MGDVTEVIVTIFEFGVLIFIGGITVFGVMLLSGINRFGYILLSVVTWLAIIVSLLGSLGYDRVLYGNLALGTFIGQLALIFEKFWGEAAARRKSEREKERDERARERNALMAIANKPAEVRVMGDYFNNITAPVFNRTHVRDAVISLEKQDSTVANALLAIAKVVQDSGSREAGELLDGFSTELQRLQPNRPVLRSLWDGLLKIVPALSNIAEATSAVAKLFT